MSSIIQNNLGLTEEGLIIPRGRKGLDPLSIHLKDIHDIEARIPEIKRSTPITLPDLVTEFTLGILKMSKILAMIELEVNEAKRTLEHDRAVALLEKADADLTLRKVKSSTDTREASIALNPDVMDSQSRLDALLAVKSFLMGKNNALEMAYHGAKKICDVYIKTPSSPLYGGEKDEPNDRNN